MWFVLWFCLNSFIFYCVCRIMVSSAVSLYCFCLVLCFEFFVLRVLMFVRILILSIELLSNMFFILYLSILLCFVKGIVLYAFNTVWLFKCLLFRLLCRIVCSSIVGFLCCVCCWFVVFSIACFSIAFSLKNIVFI